jgi:hypothetical protein
MYELVADGGGFSGVDDGLISWRAAGKDSAQLENLLSDKVHFPHMNRLEISGILMLTTALF